MPFTIPAASGLSTASHVYFAPEIGAKYTLTGPNGSIVTFNDPSDANWCGTISNVTGLDSADVRESGDVFAQTDGGWHGNFWYGRRPITLEGTCHGNSDAQVRAIKLDQLKQASNAMQQDAVLSWQNTAIGSVPMQTWVRRSQPLRFTGSWNKSFQLQLISQWAPLFSTAVHVSSLTPITNYVPDPGFEHDTIGSAPAAWSGAGLSFETNGGATISVQAVGQIGTNGLRVVTTNASNLQGTWINMGVLPAGTYTASVQVKGNAGGELIQILGGPASGSQVVSNFTATSSYTRYNVTFTADGTSSQYLTLRTQTAAAVTFFIDSAICVQGSVPYPGWFSGDTVNARWTGTVGNSTSILSQVAVTNVGDYPSAGVIRIFGPTNNPVVTNTTTGTRLQFIPGISLTAGHYIDIDVLNHTAIQDGTINKTSFIDFTQTTWPTVVAGNNVLLFSEGAASAGPTGGSFSITYRDMWS